MLKDRNKLFAISTSLNILFKIIRLIVIYKFYFLFIKRKLITSDRVFFDVVQSLFECLFSRGG